MIKIIYESDNLIVLEKPAGVLVHPTMANEDNTLTKWLTDKYPEILRLNWPDNARPGVIHRLDKDTSGLIVMAKNPDDLTKLQEQFKNRETKKIYLALVLGHIGAAGQIETEITRGEAGLQKVIEASYSFDTRSSRNAITLYKPLKYYRYKKNDLTLVEIELKTGRMHQIRVHLKYVGFPIIGDQLYNIKPSRNLSKELDSKRQFLHAHKLEFINPGSQEKMSFESKLPEDLGLVLKKLEEVND